MPLEFILFSLGSAVLWGLSPVFSKRGLSNKGTYIEASLVSVMISLVIFSGLSLVLVDDPLAILRNPAATGIFLAGGVVGSALGRLTIFEGENRVGASITSATLGTTPVFAAILGYVFLTETLSVQVMVGIGVLVLGLVLLSLSKGGEIGGWAYRDLAFPVTAAFFFAGGNVIRRYGLVEHPVDLLPAMVLNEVAALLFILLFAYWKRESVPFNLHADNLLLFSLSAVLTSAAVFCMFSALSLGPVAIVEALISTAPLFTLVFVYFFLGDLERVTGGVLLGAILVSAGAILVSFG